MLNESESVQSLELQYQHMAKLLDQAGVKLNAAKAVLAERERELLELKGPCSTEECRLHYAHSGPCDIPKNPSSAAKRAYDAQR